jgi:hypothetical protein
MNITPLWACELRANRCRLGRTGWYFRQLWNCVTLWHYRTPSQTWCYVTCCTVYSVQSCCVSVPVIGQNTLNAAVQQILQLLLPAGRHRSCWMCFRLCSVRYFLTLHCILLSVFVRWPSFTYLCYRSVSPQYHARSAATATSAIHLHCA